MCIVGALFAGWGGAETNVLALTVGLIVATAGLALASFRYVP